MEEKRTGAPAALDDDNVGVPPALPYELLANEVLARLSAKSLMRFKCVSKQWRSTIADPSFSKLRRARSSSHGLLIINPAAAAAAGDSSLRFFCANLPWMDHSPPPHQFALPLRRRRHYRASSQVVNALVCLHALDDRVALFNIATREITEFLIPKDPNSDSYNVTGLAYYFGCDSTTSKEFKLLKLSSLDRYRYVANEDEFYEIRIRESAIFTLGKDSAWRSLGCW